MGGLGNQLFQYAFALDLSKRTNSQVTLDPNFLSIRKNDAGNLDLGKYLLNSAIQIAPFRHAPLLTRKILGFALRKHLERGNLIHDFFCFLLSFLSTVLVSIHFRKLEIVRIPRDNGYFGSHYFDKKSFFVGYFQSYRYSLGQNSISGELKIKREMKSSHLEGFLKSTEKDSPLAVHIRLTDYRKEPNFGVLPAAYYAKSIEYHFEKKKYNRIWVFSDEPESVLEFIPIKFHPLVISVSEVVSDTVDTLEIMRMAKGFVVANSSFSWWAAYSSWEKSPLVTYPTPWFANMAEPRDLLPPNWHSIDR
jgi:hypothetical protein